MQPKLIEATTRNLILDAADRLFGETGFDASTTREIAEMSGVNKALIHYHFGSKEDLLSSVLDRYYERLGQTVIEALQGTQDLRTRLLCLIDTYMDFLNANRGFCRIVQREASGGKHIGQIQAHMVPLFAVGVDLVETAFPNNKQAAMAAHHMLVSLYGMIVSYFTYSDVISHLIGDDPLSPARIAERKAHLHLMLDATLTLVDPQWNSKDHATS